MPSVQDCPLVRFLALPGGGGGEDGALQWGQRVLPLGAIEIRQHLAPLLTTVIVGLDKTTDTPTDLAPHHKVMLRKIRAQ